MIGEGILVKPSKVLEPLVVGSGGIGESTQRHAIQGIIIIMEKIGVALDILHGREDYVFKPAMDITTTTYNETTY